MIDTILLMVATLLALGGIAGSSLLMRPRPSTPREILYLSVPMVGVIVLVAAAAGRL